MPTGQKKFSHHQDAKWQVLLLRPNDRRRRRRLRFRYGEPRRDSSSFSPRLAAKPVQLSADRNGRRSFPGCHGQIITRMLNVFFVPVDFVSADRYAVAAPNGGWFVDVGEGGGVEEVSVVAGSGSGGGGTVVWVVGGILLGVVLWLLGSTFHKYVRQDVNE